VNRRLLSLASVAVLALAAAPTLAQQLPAVAPPSASTAALVGRWLHDSRGEIIGSVKSVSPDGRTATIVLGVHLFDNVRVIEVPSSGLSVVNGKATLRGETAEALNASPPR
jgi:photosystem II stability/assembly factor-like uncharacterized protein